MYIKRGLRAEGDVGSFPGMFTTASKNALTLFGGELRLAGAAMIVRPDILLGVIRVNVIRWGGKLDCISSSSSSSSISKALLGEEE